LHPSSHSLHCIYQENRFHCIICYSSAWLDIHCRLSLDWIQARAAHSSPCLHIHSYTLCVILPAATIIIGVLRLLDNTLAMHSLLKTSHMSKQYNDTSLMARLGSPAAGQLVVRLSAADGSASHSWSPGAPPTRASEENSTTCLGIIANKALRRLANQRGSASCSVCKPVASASTLALGRPASQLKMRYAMRRCGELASCNGKRAVVCCAAASFTVQL
jgi:hypothetical protein